MAGRKLGLHLEVIMADKVFGIGINDLPKGDCGYRLACGSRRKHKFYQAWKDILARCYCPKVRIKRPSYEGCTMVDEWLTLSSFKKWFEENYIEGWAIDKDLLVDGNKVYGPDTCRFIPLSLNSMFTGSSSLKSNLPIGVYKSDYGKFVAQIRINKRLTYLGTFDTVSEANSKYLKAKMDQVLLVLPDYLNDGVCPDLINAVKCKVISAVNKIG